MLSKNFIFRHKRSHRRRKPRRAASRWFSPVLEWLEPRQMLAGNVTAAVNGGDLILTGDADSNSVEVAIVGGDLVVQGFDNTTINGGVEPFVAFAGSTTVTDDFFANLGAGDDVLTVDGIMITNRASVAADAGDDHIGLANVTVGTDLRILTAHGADMINLDNVMVDRDAVIDTSEQRDTVRIANSDITGDLSVRLGRYKDVLVLDTVTVGEDAGINSGNGPDDVVLIDTDITGRLKVNLQLGDDFLYIDPSTIGGASSVRGGNGNDMVVVEGANALDSLNLRLGRGADAGKIDPATTFNRAVAARNMEASDVSDEDRDTQLMHPTDGALTRSNAAVDFFEGLNNTPPTTSGIDDVEVDEDADDFDVNLFDAFADEQDPDTALTFTTTNTNQNLFNSTTISAQTGILTLNFAPDANGTAEVTVTATDQRGDSVDTTFMVTVNPVDEIPVQLDPLAGGGIQSNGTVITDDPTYTVSGTTEPNAAIVVDSDGDGFDDGSTTADGSGNFSVTVPLVHNDANNGANTVRFQASGSQNQVTTTQTNIHLSVGTVVRFDSNKGTWDVELLDADAPRTVANFLGYSDRYQNSIVHRSLANDFVIQGGGFTFDGTNVSNIPEDPAISNEFDAKNSNVRGTLSMALPPNDINDGTSEWFFNTVDNNVTVDNPNTPEIEEGMGLDDASHTVFGRVIGDGMDVVDLIEALPIHNLISTFNVTALGTVPLENFIAGTPNADNFVIFNSISTILDSTVVDTTFNVDENAAADTVVGTVTASSPLSGAAIFEIDNPTQPDALKLAPDDHTLGNPAAEVVVIEYIDYG